MQTLLFFFIYNNHSSSAVIDTTIRNIVKKKQVVFSLKLDKIIDSDESSYSVMPDFDSPKSLV